MANEPIQGGPYPEPIDPPDGPGQMSAIVGWAAGRSVMRFASIAARDAALPIPVDGMVCYVAADKTYYGRSDGRWVAVWSDPVWVNIPPASGYTAGTGADAPQVALVGGITVYRGIISGPLSTSGSTIGVVPDGFRARTLNDAARAAALTNGGTCRVATGTSGAIIVHVSSGVTTGVNLSALSGYLAS